MPAAASPRSCGPSRRTSSFGHGLFPNGGNLAACATGEYDDEQREVARRLAANRRRRRRDPSGLGGLRRLVRLVGGRQAARAVEGVLHPRRQGDEVGGAQPSASAGSWRRRGGSTSARSFPDDAPITNIGVSHYDDAEDRFGIETYKGGPWGLRAWDRYAKSKGKKFAIGEWGVGRAGDNPQYIQDMHDFLSQGSNIAHEAYFNTDQYQLYPIGPNPKSSALYQKLF